MNEVIYHFEAGTNPNLPEASKHLLHVAAKGGRFEIVKFLIGKGFDINATNSEKWTALHLASKHCHLETVKCLVEHNADINCKDALKKTPLYLAADEGHLDIVQFLIEKDANYTTAATISRSTPLLVATYRGHCEVTKYLLAFVRKKECWFAHEKVEMFMYSAKKGFLETVQSLVEEEGVDVNCKWEIENTALHESAQNGHLDVVRFLVEKGSNVLARNLIVDSTPLLLAAEKGHFETFKYLAGNGADLGDKNNLDKGVIHLAAASGSLDIVKYLIEHSATTMALVNQTARSFGTPIHQASFGGHLDIVKHLSQNGANINSQESFRTFNIFSDASPLPFQIQSFSIFSDASPLHLAAFNGHLEVVKYLVQNGADTTVACESAKVTFLNTRQILNLSKLC